MKLQNPYTRGYIEYPLYFEPEKLNYHIRHETPFSERYSEWAVSIIETGDVIYLPYGDNRCKNIYVVTKFFMDKTVTYPMGIYTVPVSNFMAPENIIIDNDNNDDFNTFEDDFELDYCDDFIVD